MTILERLQKAELEVRAAGSILGTRTWGILALSQLHQVQNEALQELEALGYAPGKILAHLRPSLPLSQVYWHITTGRKKYRALKRPSQVVSAQQPFKKPRHPNARKGNRK